MTDQQDPLYFGDNSLQFGNWLGELIETYIFSNEVELGVVRYGGEDNDMIFPKTVKYDWDSSNTYTYNSKGYRSDEFNLGTELVYSGCSFTHGDGVSSKKIWGSVVADTLGFSHSNLGIPGSSCYQIVRNLFKYFKTYGNPKVVLCLFPDLNRFYAPNVPGLFANDKYSSRRGMEQAYSEYGIGSYKLAPKYLQIPYKPNTVIPEEFAIMLSVHAIYSLIDYCKSNNIDILWSTWHDVFSKYIDLNYRKFDTSTYVDIKNSSWHHNPKTGLGTYYHPDFRADNYCTDSDCTGWATCHEDLREQWPNNFDIGTDLGTNGVSRHPHWGVHRHAHIAEAFLERL